MFAKFTLLIALVFCLLGILNSCQKENSAKEIYALNQQTKIEGVSLHLHVSQASLKTSERARVVLDIKNDPSLKITLPNLDGQFGDFTLAEVTTQPARLDFQSWEHRQISFLIEPDLPGEATLPAFEFIIENSSGESQKIHTKPIAIQVLSAGVNADTELRDIAPDERDSSPSASPNVTIAWLFFTSILIAAVVLFVRRKNQSPEVTSTIALADFLALGECSSESIIHQIEPLFCKAYSERFQLSKPCVDFDNLCRKLPTPPGALINLAARYEAAQYGTKTLSKNEVHELYQQLSKLLDKDIGKVTRS